jgi:hypothetical protein
VIGTWSSVFTASPLLIALERRFPQEGTVRGMTAPRPEQGRRAVPGAAVTDRERSIAGRRQRAVDPADPYAFVDEGAATSRRAD